MVVWWDGRAVVWWREVVVCGGAVEPRYGGVMVLWCGGLVRRCSPVWNGGVEVWCNGGVVVLWAGGVWWSRGVVVWCGGMAVWWWRGVAAYWCGGVVLLM